METGEACYRRALAFACEADGWIIRSHLLAIDLVRGRAVLDSEESQALLARHPQYGVDLLTTLTALSADNFGDAVRALGNGLMPQSPHYHDYEGFLLLAPRLFVERGFGQRLEHWFDYQRCGVAELTATSGGPGLPVSGSSITGCKS